MKRNSLPRKRKTDPGTGIAVRHDRESLDILDEARSDPIGFLARNISPLDPRRYGLDLLNRHPGLLYRSGESDYECGGDFDDRGEDYDDISGDLDDFSADFDF